MCLTNNGMYVKFSPIICSNIRANRSTWNLQCVFSKLIHNLHILINVCTTRILINVCTTSILNNACTTNILSTHTHNKQAYWSTSIVYQPHTRQAYWSTNIGYQRICTTSILINKHCISINKHCLSTHTQQEYWATSIVCNAYAQHSLFVECPTDTPKSAFAPHTRQSTRGRFRRGTRSAQRPVRVQWGQTEKAVVGVGRIGFNGIQNEKAVVVVAMVLVKTNCFNGIQNEKAVFLIVMVLNELFSILKMEKKFLLKLVKNRI